MNAIAQGNIVQNGNFQAFADHWGGLIAIIHNPNAPNDIFGYGADIYQDLTTPTPGLQHFVVFSVAADLLYNPSASVSVLLNNQAVYSFDTPPYTYNDRVHRFDQMRWQEYSFWFWSSSNTTRLEFKSQNGNAFGLAAVSVVPVPEPTGMTILIVGLMVGYAVHRKGRHQSTPRRHG
jgi:hypothetical protein